jgi:hypothetical protein
LPRIWMQFLLIKTDKLWALFLAKWSSTNCVSEKIIEGQHPKILLHQDSPRPNLELKELIHIWRRTSSNCTWRQGWWQMQLWNCTWVTTVLITLKAVQEHLLKLSCLQLVRRTQNIQLESILIYGFSPWQSCTLIIMMSSFESW